MIGKIVEYEDKLFLVVDFENEEQPWYCAYARDYYLIPYNSEMSDDLEIDLSTAQKIEVRGDKNPIKEREDKMPYTSYGTSKIRGVKKIYLERIWEEIKRPTR